MAKSRDTKLISIISGKGGTGKSLFTAVLGNCLSKENCRVLLVDLDIHVRGLTILLTKYMATSDERMSVSGALSAETNAQNIYNDFAVFRFQECEFIPAVLDIAEPLCGNYGTSAFENFFRQLKLFADGQYDIVLLDCRSGLDDAVVLSANNSDYIISISEDDDVCLQANTNLVNYLRYRENLVNIYTVINKGRRISTKSDIEAKINSIFDFSCIGAIPFDERIMEDYGKDRFWLSVYETLYFYGIVKFWRNFQEKTHLSFKIDEEKYNFKDELKSNAIAVSSYARIMKIYGFFAIIIGILLPIIFALAGLDVFYDRDYFIRYYGTGILISCLGLIIIFVSSGKFRLFILGKDDNPQKLGK